LGPRASWIFPNCLDCIDIRDHRLGLPLSPTCIIPFPSRDIKLHTKRGVDLQSFNKKITTAHSIVQKSFGDLKRRFPLLTKLSLSEKEVFAFTEAAIILFNIVKRLHEDDSDVPLAVYMSSETNAVRTCHDLLNSPILRHGEEDEERALGERAREALVKKISQVDTTSP